jgi:hypothetical protein
MSLTENLPKALTELKWRPLFVIKLDVQKPAVIGATPGGMRRVGIVPSGRFEGERMSGVALDGGSDWQTVRPDHATTLDVRLLLKTDDGALIGMNYRGIRAGTEDVIKRIDAGESVDPSEYYFRISPMFETAAANYDWLNRIMAIGIGHRPPSGPVYSIFEIL